MKRIASFFLSLFLLGGIARSQVSNIGIVVDTPFVFFDTVAIADTGIRFINVINYGPDSIPSGTQFEIHTELDTGSGFVLINLAYTPPTSSAFNPGDSLAVTWSDLYYVNGGSPPGPYRIGGNIVVIWPAAYMTPNVFTNDSLVFNVYIYDPNGVIEFINGEIVNVYPNPTKSELNISKSGSEILPERVRIYDVSGKEVLLAENTKTVSIAHLAAGIYYVKVHFSNNSKKTFKIVKQDK